MDDLAAIDERLRYALFELKQVISQYETALFEKDAPFSAFEYPSRIKRRVRIIEDLRLERARALNESKRSVER